MLARGEHIMWELFIDTLMKCWLIILLYVLIILLAYEQMALKKLYVLP